MATVTGRAKSDRLRVSTAGSRATTKAVCRNFDTFLSRCCTTTSVNPLVTYHHSKSIESKPCQRTSSVLNNCGSELLKFEWPRENKCSDKRKNN